MEYRIVPKNGDQISVMSYGCMRFPLLNGHIDEEQAKKLLYYAIDQGVNYLDTAYPYHKGESESFLGRALKDGYRDKVFIATKLPIWRVNSRDDMERILQDQLQKLQTDCIDYYLLHMLMGTESYERVKALGVLEFLEGAKAAGKIKNIGFSYHGNTEEFKKIIDDYDWCLAQIQFNYLDMHTQAGLEGLKYASEKGIAVVIMEPLRGGVLASKIPDQGKKIMEKSNRDWSFAEWSFRFILNYPEVVTVLSGMSEMSHIKENIRIATDMRADTLLPEDTKVIMTVKEIFEKNMKVPCTGCGYCMPCPAGVNIPMCFSYYNEKFLFKKKKSRWMYLGTMGGLIGDKKSVASLCIECGKCEKVCPQHIEVIKELKTVKKKFEGVLYPVAKVSSDLYHKMIRYNKK